MYAIIGDPVNSYHRYAYFSINEYRSVKNAKTAAKEWICNEIGKEIAGGNLEAYNWRTKILSNVDAHRIRSKDGSLVYTSDWAENSPLFQD